MNLYSRSKRQLYIRHIQLKPLDRAGRIDNILEELGCQRRENHRCRRKNTVSDAAEKQ